MKKHLAAIGCFLFALNANATTIKLATLAPEGTSWMNYLREFDAEIRKATKNEVQLKIYPGGSMGDENVVLQKMRAGQLNAAGITGIGLGQIESAERVIEMPFMFDNYNEIDHVVSKISNRLEKLFYEKGFTVLGWTEAGMVYFFSKTPITSLETLKSVKMWAWNADPVAKIMFKEFDIKPVPLELPDVPMSLDTGIITACYSVPLAALSLQWSPRVNYITKQSLAYASGALLVKNDIMDKLSKENQKILSDLGHKYAKLITASVRKENQDAFDFFVKDGKKVVQFDSSQEKAIREKSRAIRKNLVGQFYTKELHNDVIKYRNEFRQNKLDSLKTEIQKLKKTQNKEQIQKTEAEANDMNELLKASGKDLI